MAADLQNAPVLTSLLREVSRSFYLTLWVLPKAVREPIGLGYLLARATDTIADTALVPLLERTEALVALRDRVLGNRKTRLDLASLAAAQTGKFSAAERVLLLRLEEAIAILESQSEFDRARIREVLATITAGQLLDLERFGGVERGGVRALETDAELDDYTYRVAGCVGEFWTHLTRKHVFPDAPIDADRFLEAGIRFGKGLQLVNILRDLPGDLRSGRCYIPRESLSAIGLEPDELLATSAENHLRPLYLSLVERAQGHLEAGWEYTGMIPARFFRLRLACAWPLLIGARTLGMLRQGPDLAEGAKIKVPRPEVRQILWQSVLRLPSRRRWDCLFQEWRERPVVPGPSRRNS
ncbi:MAG TPA: phytoene/squalene synthase family protein [Candidatus Limnocylindria bacterium]|nr:phytoene/squalene synthase family protein [Candidatus Limnocylindria bacterium]